MKHHEKVFAKFMGLSKGHPDKKETRWKDDWFEQLKVDGNEFESGRRHTHLFFTDDWNWLMAVITKIESLGYQVKIDTNYTQIFTKGLNIIIGGEGKLTNTVTAAKDFINLYKIISVK
jgi:hypothetical protein